MRFVLLLFLIFIVFCFQNCSEKGFRLSSTKQSSLEDSNPTDPDSNRKGDGTFGAGIEISGSTGHARSVALGDLNSDGILDIVIGNSHSAEPNRFYLGDGKGNFDTGTDLTTDAYSTTSVVLGDLNGDGVLDLVTGNANQRNRVYLGNGRGGFSAGSDVSSDVHWTYSVVLGDLNGDGILDLVAGNVRSQTETNRVYLGNGRGGFSAGSDVSSDVLQTESLALGDLNNDGNLDLIVVGSFHRIFLGNGRGGFGAGIEFVSDRYNLNTVATGDLKNDGNLDIVVGRKNQAGNAYSHLYFGDGTGRFNNRKDILDQEYGVQSMALGDLNGDGILDLVAGNGGYENDFNRVYLGDGRWGFGEGTDVTRADNDNYDTRAIALGDLNGDGVLDLVAVGSGNRRVYLGNHR